MIRALRGSRGRSALAALMVSALLAVTVSVSVHDGTDDRDCSGALSGAAAGPSRISAGQASARAADHCVLCHTAQTVRAVPAVARYAPPSESLAAALPPPLETAASIAGAARPARAPPLA